ncbi:MAG: sigma-54-dependent Fis family transcriptional regulator [Candidatus Sabulitectum sp.]|nr:sigma-54-dependent Fis family transcriptional regulator [Candidatus Sabulitectum sp.]
MKGSRREYRVLIVDDEPEILDFVKEVLTSNGFLCDFASNCRQALAKLRVQTYHLLITDIRLPDGSGIDIIRIAREKHPYMAAMVITGFASIEGIKEAMDLGAMDYIPKPFSAEQLLNAVEAVIKKQRRGRHSSAKLLILNSPAMENVMKLVEKVSITDSTVLLTGESGTGKEMVARALHRMSRKSAGPFVSVNSGGIPEGLLESELFGHVKGAYTGAHATTMGHFQAAENGTLFMDEIGSMSQPMQVKLLRALQEREVTPVGASTPIPVNARFISATNSDIRQGVEDGSFRRDLFYRLNVFEIRIPPLRERPADIIPLAEHFLNNIQGPSSDKKLSDRALTALLTYSWPGNVRELENVIERAVILAGNKEIHLEHLPGWISDPSRGSIKTLTGNEIVPLDVIVSSIERHYIQKALTASGGVRSKAARRLGLKRTTLLARMKKLGIKEG